MDFWTLSALLFSIGVISSYPILFRPQLPHMSRGRKGVLILATVFLVVYVFLMGRMLNMLLSLQTGPLVIMVLLSSAAASALVLEMIRAIFFRGIVWRDRFHFLIVAICWVAIFIIQSALIIVGRSGLS